MITLGAAPRWATAALLAVSAVLITNGALAEDRFSGRAFPVERLNAGLGEPPEALDRSTPRATMESFMQFTGEAADARAAHLLDLAPVPVAEQAGRGPELARELAYILDRKVPVPFDALPDRPDGMETVGSERQPMIGEPRRSIAIGSLDLDRWPVSIRLNRVAADGEAPVWVVSRQTVENIPDLYAKFGPTAIERALPDVLRGEAVAGFLWWEFLALPAVLAVAVGLGYALYRALTVTARRMPHGGVSLGMERMRLPLTLLVVGGFLHLALSSLFMFSATTTTTLSTLFWSLIVLALVFGAGRILDTIIDVTSNRALDSIDDPRNTNARQWYTNLSALKRVGVIAVIVAGLAWALASLELFSSFGLSLLVAAGVATAVFGFAAQTVLGNIVASLQLALAKPIRIGDAVLYDDHWAYVERINYTFVQLRTWDMKRYVVPVRNFVSEAFENWTKEDPELIVPVLLKLDHRTDVEAMRRAFHDMAPRDPDWSENAAPKVEVVGHDEHGVNVRFYCTANNPTAAWNLHCRMRERLLAFLRRQDEPSDWPRLRLARVGDTTGEDVSAPAAYEDGFDEDTGEPKARPLSEARSEAAE